MEFYLIEQNGYLKSFFVVLANRCKWKLVAMIRISQEYTSKETLRHVGFEEHYWSTGRNNAVITRVTVTHAPIKLAEKTCLEFTMLGLDGSRRVSQLIRATYFFAQRIICQSLAQKMSTQISLSNWCERFINLPKILMMYLSIVSIHLHSDPLDYPLQNTW